MKRRLDWLLKTWHSDATAEERGHHAFYRGQRVTCERYRAMLGVLPDDVAALAMFVEARRGSDAAPLSLDAGRQVIEDSLLDELRRAQGGRGVLAA